MIETKKRSLILNIVLGAILLVIAFLFWPNENRSKQSNEIDVTKTQIEIKVKRINIRKEPTVESDDIGDVYMGEIYTVLSHVDADDYYWYHIKTSTDVEGFIASSKDKESVELLSGYIDRTPPVIESDEEFLLFYEGEVKYDSVRCIDDKTECTLSYEITDPEYIVFKGIDKDLNETKYRMKYYKIYQLENEYYDNDEDINSMYNLIYNKDVYTLSAKYSIKRNIRNVDKSDSYTPIIDFYDENFNLLENRLVYYDTDVMNNKCINKSNFSLKDAYLYSNLVKGSTLCINYTFENNNKDIKYIAFGFSSDENYTNKDNILSSYYSKYFILK